MVLLFDSVQIFSFTQSNVIKYLFTFLKQKIIMKKLFLLLFTFISLFSYAQVQLKAKVFLNNYDASTGLMPDNFRNDVTNFPLTDPYLNSVTTNTKVLGAFNVVDWALIELRQDCDIAAQKAVLITNDGNIIDEQGNFLLSFNAPLGQYRVVIHHRNHLVLATDKPVNLNTPKFLDFTTTGVLGNISANTSFISNTNGTISMVGGNGVNDDIIDSQDDNLWIGENGNWGNYFDNSDYNLDGSVDAFDSIFITLNQGLTSDPCN
jgi:hypothetical protein